MHPCGKLGFFLDVYVTELWIKSMYQSCNQSPAQLKRRSQIVPAEKEVKEKKLPRCRPNHYTAVYSGQA